MNTKTIFYLSLGLGVLPTLAGLGSVRTEQQERSMVRDERRSLERAAMDSLRESQLGLKWARRCTPVFDTDTRKEFPLAPGMRFVTEDNRDIIGGNRIVCNSTADVAEVVDGYVTRVITIASEDREEYSRIFATLLNSQVGTQPSYDGPNQSIEEPHVQPPPPRD